VACIHADGRLHQRTHIKEEASSLLFVEPCRKPAASAERFCEAQVCLWANLPVKFWYSYRLPESQCRPEQALLPYAAPGQRRMQPPLFVMAMVYSLRLFRRADLSEQSQPCGHLACAAFHMQPSPAGRVRPALHNHLPY